MRCIGERVDARLTAPHIARSASKVARMIRTSRIGVDRSRGAAHARGSTPGGIIVFGAQRCSRALMKAREALNPTRLVLTGRISTTCRHRTLFRAIAAVIHIRIEVDARRAALGRRVARARVPASLWRAERCVGGTARAAWIRVGVGRGPGIRRSPGVGERLALFEAENPTACRREHHAHERRADAELPTYHHQIPFTVTAPDPTPGNTPAETLTRGAPPVSARADGAVTQRTAPATKASAPPVTSAVATRPF